jgi:hypothetical protein
VSLKSRKSIDTAGPDKHDETVVTFRKEVDGTYTKVTKTMSRDWKTGGVQQLKRLKPVEDGPFVLSRDPDTYDEKTSYEDIDGTIQYMYFKRAETLNETS